jgi:LAS superfamily LD-carboxypeptidase LdcB
MLTALLSLLIAAEPVEGYTEGEPVVVVVARVPGIDLDGCPVRLEDEAAMAFQELLEHALRSGVELKVNYGFRTQEQQRELRRRNGRRAARPGFSDHQLGISVDIAGTRERVGRHWRKTPLFFWLMREAPRFGFVNDVKREPWHWTWRPDATTSRLH